MARRPLISPWKASDDALLHALAHQGRSVWHIAKKLKKHRTTVKRRARMLNIPLHDIDAHDFSAADETRG